MVKSVQNAERSHLKNETANFSIILLLQYDTVSDRSMCGLPCQTNKGEWFIIKHGSFEQLFKHERDCKPYALMSRGQRILQFVKHMASYDIIYKKNWPTKSAQYNVMSEQQMLTNKQIFRSTINFFSLYWIYLETRIRSSPTFPLCTRSNVTTFCPCDLDDNILARLW